MKTKNFYYLISFMMISFLMMLGGCKESEIHYSHAKHIKRGLNDCNTCHPHKEDLEPKWPKMANCLICHKKDFDPRNPKSCLFCHTKLKPKTITKHRHLPKRYQELKFTHKVHLENKVGCIQCHKGIETSDSIVADLIPSMLDTCFPCHKERGKERIACNVCHKYIKENHMPLYHEDRWVKHDDPLWIQKHGNEFYYNQDYCKRCHTDLDTCVNCHQDQKPKSHNNAWRRKTHGFVASWDRRKCSVCHQEDFCVRCHESTTPLNHVASWGSPINRHCRNCHIPISNVSCMVCHPNPTHPSAQFVPHPQPTGSCPECHPGGIPGKPPHPNLDDIGIECEVCHNK